MGDTLVPSSFLGVLDPVHLSDGVCWYVVGLLYVPKHVLIVDVACDGDEWD